MIVTHERTISFLATALNLFPDGPRANSTATALGSSSDPRVVVSNRTRVAVALITTVRFLRLSTSGVR